MAIPRLELDDTALLVVDVQERLLPAMHNAADVERQVARMIDGANVLEVPILVTEQYRKGLGLTVPALADRLASAVCVEEKLKFSACVEPVLATLKRRAIRSVVVVGIEAHVCVMQTCLDLMESGYVVAVAVDAIGSRRALDQRTAVERLIRSGILPTTVESVLLELVREAGTARFKAILPVIK